MKQISWKFIYANRMWRCVINVSNNKKADEILYKFVWKGFYDHSVYITNIFILPTIFSLFYIIILGQRIARFLLEERILEVFRASIWNVSLYLKWI